MRWTPALLLLVTALVLSCFATPGSLTGPADEASRSGSGADQPSPRTRPTGGALQLGEALPEPVLWDRRRPSAGQRVLNKRIAQLSQSVDEEVLASGPTSLQYGVLGVAGTWREGYVVVVAADGDPSSIRRRVLRGVPDDVRKQVRFVASDVSSSAVRDAWKQVSKSSWRNAESDVSFTVQMDAATERIVVSVSFDVTADELTRLRSIDPDLVTVIPGQPRLFRV